MAKEILTGIYKITNLDNGKMYVGQAKDIYSRWSQHKSGLRGNYHENGRLQNSWNCHGEGKFTFEIIELCDAEELDEREIYWINQLRTYVGFEDCNGYNLTLGGGGTKYVREVLQFDLDGNFIREWNSARDASVALGINIQAINCCCLKMYKYGKGYIWIYKEDYIDETSLEWYLDRKELNRVLQYDKNANLVKVYESLAEAKKKVGQSVCSCVTHNNATAYGYIFVYESEKDMITKEYCDWAFTLLNNICNKPFVQLDKDANIVKRYNSLREATEDGYNEKMINDCIRGLRNKYKGYVWAYEESLYLYTKDRCNELFNKKEPNYRGVPILQYKDDVLINRYEALSKVPSEFLKTNIAECCKGRKPQYKGFVWKYDLDD